MVRSRGPWKLQPDKRRSFLKSIKIESSTCSKNNLSYLFALKTLRHHLESLIMGVSINMGVNSIKDISLIIRVSPITGVSLMTGVSRITGVKKHPKKF